MSSLWSALLVCLLTGALVALAELDAPLVASEYPHHSRLYTILARRSSPPATYCLGGNCGPYVVEFDYLTSVKYWWWNDSTPLGSMISKATLSLQGTFCDTMAEWDDNTTVTLTPSVNFHPAPNVTIDDPWCPENRTLITADVELYGRRTNSGINLRSANILTLTLPSNNAIALIAEITLQLHVVTLAPNYTRTKPLYPFVCHEDLVVELWAYATNLDSQYQCTFLGNAVIVPSSVVRSGNTTTLYRCVFPAQTLSYLGLCASLQPGMASEFQFSFHPSGYPAVEFPSDVIEIYGPPTAMKLSRTLIRGNESAILYIHSHREFVMSAALHVRLNETAVDALFVNRSTLVIRVPSMPQGTHGCLYVAENGVDFVPSNCSLRLRYGNSSVPLPPPSPDPFVPHPWSPLSPVPEPYVPIDTSSTYESFEAFSRKYWWIYLLVGLMILILAMAFACVRNTRTTEPEYSPLGNLVDLDLDPRVYVSAKEVRIDTLIGHGSFASVHVGEWRGTKVAVKRLHPHMEESSKSDFVREASLMMNLRHPNIVALMALTRTEDSISIICEYLERGSLDDLLRDTRLVFEEEHVRRLALDAATGMTYLHAAGVIHRDLKCGNLLVDKDWNVKVADFGLSRTDNSDATMTACGTPSWAAPEVIRHQKYTLRADVFSFGICLWEMCTRSKPYEDIPPYQVVIAVAMKGLRPKLSPKIHKSFMRLMVRCWDDKPSVRPPFDEVVAFLRALECPRPTYLHPCDPSDNSAQHARSPERSTGERADRSQERHRLVSSDGTNSSVDGTSLDKDSCLAPAMPEMPLPSSADTDVGPRHPFAPSPLPSPSFSGSSSGSPSSEPSRKKKKPKFGAYSVTAASDSSNSAGKSLPPISESPKRRQRQNQGGLRRQKSENDSDSRDFVISL